MQGSLSAFSRGQGPQHVLLLHGLLGSGRNLASLARTWSQRHPKATFHCVDLPGHGESPPLSSTPHLAELGQGVLTWIEQQRFDSVDIVGHSMGGRTALSCLDQQPTVVSSVTLLDISPAAQSESLGEFTPVFDAMRTALKRAASREPVRRHLTGHGVSDPIADWLLMNFVRGNDGDFVWRIDRERLAALYQNTRTVDQWHVVERHPRKVRACIRGSRSPFVSERDQQRFGSHNIPVHTVQAGHFVHAEALGALVDTLCDLF